MTSPPKDIAPCLTVPVILTDLSYTKDGAFVGPFNYYNLVVACALCSGGAE